MRDADKLRADGDSFFIQQRLRKSLNCYEDASGLIAEAALHDSEAAARLADLCARQSVVRLELGQYDSAVELATEATQWNPQSPFAWYRLGLARERLSTRRKAPHQLKDMEAAIEAFTQAKTLAQDEDKSESLKYDNLAKKATAARARMENMSSISGDGAASVVRDVEPDHTKASPSGDVSANIPEQAPTSRMAKPPPVRWQFFQDNDKVVLTVFAKGVLNEDSAVKVSESSVSLHLRRAGEVDHESVIQLFEKVNPSNPKVEISALKVEVTLMKSRSGWWPRFEYNVETSASESGSKNWDKLVVEGDGGEEDVPEGDSLQNLFRKIYSDADEDTRRAMNKSFVESGGKVLSTNWKEVSQKKVEYVEKDA